MAETRGRYKNLVAEARSELAKPEHTPKAVMNEKPKQAEPGVVRSLWDDLIRARRALWDRASEFAAAANTALVAALAWFTGESTQEARQQVERKEEAVKKVATELTEDEAVQVIEAVILTAV